MAGAASNEADKVWDVVIVGSGFAGALIAHELGKAKKEVLILEAGAPIPTNINDYMTRFYAAAAKVPESPYTPEIFDNNGLVDPATINAGRPTVLTLGPTGAKFGDWTNAKQAYLVQTGPTPFTSTYDRIAGGTGHWLGTSLRFVPNDFKMKSAYGQFTDWPIGYDDLEHWYGEAEAELGVSADKADQEYLGIKISRNYPMQRIPPSLVDQYVDRSLNAKPLTEAETGFLGAGKLETQPAGGAQFRTLSQPPRLRRQHQLHSDLPDPGQIRPDGIVERRDGDRLREDDASHGRERHRGRRERPRQPYQVHPLSARQGPAQRCKAGRGEGQGVRDRGKRDRDRQAAADVQGQNGHRQQQRHGRPAFDGPSLLRLLRHGPDADLSVSRAADHLGDR